MGENGGRKRLEDERVTTCGGNCGGHGAKDFGSFDYGWAVRVEAPEMDVKVDKEVWS